MSRPLHPRPLPAPSGTDGPATARSRPGPDSQTGPAPLGAATGPEDATGPVDATGPLHAPGLVGVTGLVDVHCHLDDQRLDGLSDAWIAGAAAVGVQHHVIGGVQPAQWARAQRLANRHRTVTLSHGLHPAWVASGADWRAALHDLAALQPKLLGECGLDARYPNLAEQEDAFRAQLALARALDVPVVLHIVRAHDRALAVLLRDGLPRRMGLVHSFSGARELATRYLRCGLSLSFSGGLLRAPTHRRLVETLIATPVERVLLETDAPDQAPVERARDGTWLPEVLAMAAQIRGEQPDVLARATTRNAVVLLGLDSA